MISTFLMRTHSCDHWDEKAVDMARILGGIFVAEEGYCRAVWLAERGGYAPHLIERSINSSTFLD